MSRKTKAAPEAAPAYDWTPEDKAKVEAMDAASKREGRIKIKQVGNSATLSPDHPSISVGFARLAETLGVDSDTFTLGIISDLSRLGPNDSPEVRQDRANFALSVVAQVKPTNGIEALLAAQMAVVHMATIRAAGALSRADVLPQYEAYDRALNRLSRTFAAQAEALAKLRGGGKQIVEVRRYEVRGNNVVVGDVHHGGGDTGGNPAQPYEPRAIGFDPGQTVPPLRGEDAAGDALPVSRDDGEAPL